MKHILLFLCVLLMSSTASAADWIDSCLQDSNRDLVTTSSSIVTTLTPGRYACAETITNTDDTTILSVGGCNHIDVFQYNDPDGDDDISTVTGQPQICPDNTADDSSCGNFGLAAFSGDVYLEGLGVSFFRVQAAGTTDTAPVRWEVRCVSPSYK